MSHAILVTLGVLGCIMEGRQAVYVSAPITTGPRFLHWRTGTGSQLTTTDDRYSNEHRRNVVTPNRERVQPVVRRVREHFGGVVIDPTALDDVPGWTQSDYHLLWVEVVRRYAHTVVFADGWEFSTGCTHEFLAALQSEAILLQEDLSALDARAGVQLIERAIRAMEGASIPTHPLAESLREVWLWVEDRERRTNTWAGE